MKFRRAVAMAIAIILVLSLAGCSKSSVVEELEYNSDVYTEVVQNAVIRYGIVDESKAETSFDYDANPFTGIIDAKLLDVTGDGREELFLMYFDDGIHMEIYESNGIRAVKKWSTLEPYGGIFGVNFYKTPQGVIWSWNSSRYFASDMVMYRDGEYISAAEKGEFTEAELSRYREGEYFTGGLMQEGEAYYKIFADRLGADVSKNEYGGEMHLFTYSVEGLLRPVDKDAFLTEWNVKIPSERVSPVYALSKIKYYGDSSICKMSPEMAKAYAEAIESDKSLIGKEGYYDSSLRAALVDVAGDGMPLLVTATAGLQAYDGWYEMSELSLWTWNGIEAEKYDFEADTITGYTFGHDFYPGGGKAAIVVGDGCALDVGGYDGTMFYAVSDAQISKIRHEMFYTAYVDYEDDSMANGRQLPFVETAMQAEYGYTAPIEDLIEAGWDAEIFEGEYSSFSAYSVDGVQVSGRESFWNEYSSAESNEKERYEIYYASTGMYELSAETTPADDSIEALRQYSETAGKPYYRTYTDVSEILTEAQVGAMSEDVAKKFGGTVGEIYRLSDDLYYVTVYVDGKFAGGSVVKNISNGKAWKIESSSDEIMTEESLAKIVTDDNSVSNITIDYTETEDVQEYIAGVFGDIDGSVPNDAAKEELSDYARRYISEKGCSNVKAKKNSIVVKGENIADAEEKASEAEAEFDSAMEKQGVELNKQVKVILNIVCKNMSADEPMQITIDGDCADAIGEADAVKVQLCDGHGIEISKDNLLSIIDINGTVVIVVSKNADGYSIQFADKEGDVIEQLCAPVTFILPAENELCTVYAEYRGGTDNWGGQFDRLGKVLSFETPFTGKYTVVEEDIDISDISELSDEYQKAIRFMVSKGYFELDDGKFNPDETLTRYSFTEALVRMFFILDRSMTTTFSDVPGNSPYYSYVASGENAGIVEGYDDNTFRGENAVLKQEVLGLCSRTLKERKGYTEPSEPDEFLHFTDNDRIAKWAEKEIALTVRENLIGDGGMLYPDMEISRADGALFLYRLFMLLYEVEPAVANSESGMSVSDIAIGVVTGTGVAAVLVGIAIVVLIKKRKKNRI